MAATVALFKVRYPEFDPLDDPHVQAQLDEIELRVADHWGDRRDEIVYLELADKLANSPFGRNAKITDKTGKSRSTYARTLDRLVGEHATAVAGRFF